jgi:hypothetical protein
MNYLGGRIVFCCLSFVNTLLPPHFAGILTSIAHIPVPVPKSRIRCGWGSMGARNSFFSSSITYFAWDISIRSNSSSSIGRPYSMRQCQRFCRTQGISLEFAPSFPYAAYVLPCSSTPRATADDRVSVNDPDLPKINTVLACAGVV